MFSNRRVVGITLAFVVASVLATVGILSGLTQSLVGFTSLPSLGNVKAIGVGVYWDRACSSKVTVVDWGLVDPGSENNVTVFIRNEGNVAATLSLETTNWNPSNASDYITLNWDYTGQAVDPRSVIEVDFILAVSLSIAGITNFSFDIVIVGSD